MPSTFCFSAHGPTLAVFACENLDQYTARLHCVSACVCECVCKVNTAQALSQAMRVLSTWPHREQKREGAADSGIEREQYKLYSLTHFCSRQHKAGFLKGPGAQEATLQTCCSAWLTDQASLQRSCDGVVTINPCFTVPSSWNCEPHAVPHFNNKRLVFVKILSHFFCTISV